MRAAGVVQCIRRGTLVLHQELIKFPFGPYSGVFYLNELSVLTRPVNGEIGAIRAD